MNNSSEEKKIQFILDENGKLAEMPKEDAVLIEHPIKVPLKNAFEVFVRVKDTENYWISNYGRCVNNLNRKDKNTFYQHKQGNVHLTVFETEHYERIITRGKKKGQKVTETNRYRRETSPEILVAESFLVKYKGRDRVWHKDGDPANNWYKNLIYVSRNDLAGLKAGNITLESLGLKQGYIEYQNKASENAYHVYDGIMARCIKCTLCQVQKVCVLVNIAIFIWIVLLAALSYPFAYPAVGVKVTAGEAEPMP